MTSSRFTYFAFGASAMLLAALASAPSRAMACGDKDEACACGAAAAQASEPKGGAAAMPAACANGDHACACSRAAAAAAAADTAAVADAGAKAAAPAKAAGAQQRAVIDPATGRLIVPKDRAAVQQDLAIPAPAARAAPVQIVQPDGSVMAPFPIERSARAVATIDENGAAHTGCAE